MLWSLQKRSKAQQLLDKVFDHLELVEKDYFGLQFIDMAPGEDGMVSSQGQLFFQLLLRKYFWWDLEKFQRGWRKDIFI